jgi:hypothetical protein
MQRHGVVIDDFDIFGDTERSEGCRGHGFVGRVFPGEAHVLGGEVLAIVPLHALAQLPRDLAAILGNTAVLQ